MVTLALTAGAALFGAAVFTLAVVLPSMVDKLLPVGVALENTISVARWPVLAALMCFALAALYRFAPAVKRGSGGGSAAVR
jgi:membrane protein